MTDASPVAFRTAILAVAALALAPTVHAAPLDIPNDFSPGDPIAADDFNENFEEIEAAVDDNDARITAIEDDLAVIGAVPSGAVVFFNLSVCPSGWTEMTGLRGRVPLALPLGGLVGAVVGTELADEGLRTISEVPLHTHTVDPPALTTASTGDHLHSVNPPVAGSSLTGAHTHTVNPPSTTTSTNGSHTHVVDNGNGGVDTTHLQAANSAGDNAVNDSSTPIGAAGNHTHTVDIAQFNSGTTGDHFHTVDIPQFSSGNAGAHTHTVDIPSFSSAAAGATAVDVTMPYMQLLACQKN